MAGFNFTLAATLGIASVLATIILFLRHRQREARDLAWFALCIFIGSLPVASGMLLSGFHNLAPGFPFRGPNLEFPTVTWGALLGRMLPSVLIPWASLILFPIVAYGVKLSGASAMLRLELNGARHRDLAMVLAIAFALSFIVGSFFPYQGMGQAFIFLQPTLWILGLFSLRPIDAWLERNRGCWRPIALWAMLGLTWVEALGAFNFSSRAVFGHDTAEAFHDIRSQAAPDDVVAYLPSDFIEEPILGRAEGSTNFSVLAMTGLAGYFSSESYSKYSAVPGLSGHDPAEVLAQAEGLYEQRRDDVKSFLKGDITNAAYAHLASDHVRWIVVSGDALQGISSSTIPWRKTREMSVFRVSR
jgi:hypothetical protein